MLLLAVCLAPLAGCGDTGADATEGSTTGALSTPSSSSDSVETTESTPTVDADVVRWKKRWAIKIGSPVGYAAKVLAANAEPAVAGDASASFKLTSAFDKLSNCRNPLDFPPLVNTPSVLRDARKLTLSACRSFYIGTDKVVAGMNAMSTTTVTAGARIIKQGEKTLRRAAAAVKAAPETQ